MFSVSIAVLSAHIVNCEEVEAGYAEIAHKVLACGRTPAASALAPALQPELLPLRVIVL